MNYDNIDKYEFEKWYKSYISKEESCNKDLKDAFYDAFCAGIEHETKRLDIYANY